MAVFNHRTYAEFLAAKWLVDIVRRKNESIPYLESYKVNNLLELLHLEELTNIRVFFDKILFRDLPLFKAVANHDYEKIKYIISENVDSLNTTDLLDRTVFHVMMSYSYRYNMEELPEIDMKDKRDLMFGLNVVGYSLLFGSLDELDEILKYPKIELTPFPKRHKQKLLFEHSIRNEFQEIFAHLLKYLKEGLSDVKVTFHLDKMSLLHLAIKKCNCDS
ncbi:hypothetical protein JTB14_007833 [Gonioctena quinquepunctata]|nr:hypothetical protein JTB14_007833 [Gonioctena quinquepunctata]